jgi:hypothetical protein
MGADVQKSGKFVVEPAHDQIWIAEICIAFLALWVYLFPFSTVTRCQSLQRRSARASFIVRDNQGARSTDIIDTSRDIMTLLPRQSQFAYYRPSLHAQR